MNPNSISTGLGKAITALTKPDALLPILALETTVVAGRTYHAYKRGGADEARERVIEETIGSIVWLWGVAFFNAIGNKIMSKSLKLKDIDVDVGKDIVRNPFKNYIAKLSASRPELSETKVATMKASKIALSILAANLVIGALVPKFNHALTNKKNADNQKSKFNLSEQQQNEINCNTDLFKKFMENRNTRVPSNNPSFKSMMSGINVFTNFIENTSTGKLLSCDIGVLTGRTMNARKKEERREIVIRDGGSIYFYMWAPAHIGKLMNLIETKGTHATRLNPNATNILHEELVKFLQLNGNSMDSSVFRDKFLGKDKIALSENLVFSDKEKLSKITQFFNRFRKKPVRPTEIIETEKFLSFLDNNLNGEQLAKMKSRAVEMSKLQPAKEGIQILTREQIKDIFRKGQINSPEFLKKAFDFESGKTASNPNKYCSHKKLYKFKKQMVDYVDNLCKNNNTIDSQALNKAKAKNLRLNGLNFLTGFVVSALFLSTFIPKIQYYVTRKKTGVDAFPGTYNYKENSKS